jgi:transposase
VTDNPRTVTVEHVAGIPVSHPDMVALSRHYGAVVQTCRPFDPESKGGTEATVKIAKADLVRSAEKSDGHPPGVLMTTSQDNT